MTTSSPSSRLRIRLCLLTRFTCNGFCLESTSTIGVEFATRTLQVQHDHLLDTSVIDITTVDLVVNALNYSFPTFDYRNY
ncbi:hypothetical protein ZWY2020_039104 [Hordeum vulgare]|nr:hypothetical protein ZWY2020_039104 [Hordeum vulgare]